MYAPPLAEPQASTGAAVTVTVLEQLMAPVLRPRLSVTLTLAVLVPVVLYDLVTEMVEPVGPSLPPQVYVYGDTPPLGLAVQVVFWPVVTLVSEAAQETAGQVVGALLFTTVEGVPAPATFQARTL